MRWSIGVPPIESGTGGNWKPAVVLSTNSRMRSWMRDLPRAQSQTRHRTLYGCFGLTWDV